MTGNEKGKCSSTMKGSIFEKKRLGKDGKPKFKPSKETACLYVRDMNRRLSHSMKD